MGKVIEMVRTEMSKTAPRAGNRNPITWFRPAVLQRTVYGDTLNTRMSTFLVAMLWRETSDTHRAKERSCVFAFEVLGNRRDVSNIGNLIAQNIYASQTGKESSESYHILGERPIHGVSAEFRLGTVCKSITHLSIENRGRGPKRTLFQAFATLLAM
jgi:hypothetical protein